MKKEDIKAFTGNREIKFIRNWKILDLTLGCSLGRGPKRICYCSDKNPTSLSKLKWESGNQCRWI